MTRANKRRNGQDPLPTPPQIVVKWASDPHRRSLVVLAEASEAHQQTTLWLAEAVRQARRAGASWATVGEVLGMTGEGARRRYVHQDTPTKR